MATSFVPRNGRFLKNGTCLVTCPSGCLEGNLVGSAHVLEIVWVCHSIDPIPGHTRTFFFAVHGVFINQLGL